MPGDKVVGRGRKAPHRVVAVENFAHVVGDREYTAFIKMRIKVAAVADLNVT